MCNYPAARRGDESSAAALFPAFPNDPAQHLLSEYSMQMMQLESPLADCFPRHQSVVFSSRLIHCLLRCSSPPSPLPNPIKASRQSRLGGRGDTLETLWNPRLGWHWVQVTPACRSPEQGWWQRGASAASAALSRIPASWHLGWASKEGRPCQKRDTSAFSLQPRILMGSQKVIPDAKLCCWSVGTQRELGEGKESSPAFQTEEIAALVFMRENTRQCVWNDQILCPNVFLWFIIKAKLLFVEKETLCSVVSHTDFPSPVKLFHFNRILVVSGQDIFPGCQK